MNADIGRRAGALALAAGFLTTASAALPQGGVAPEGALGGALDGKLVRPEDGPFRRIASFPVFLNTDVEDQTVAEIVTAAEGGDLLVYTDSETDKLGFVDITDPYAPLAEGTVDLPGEPTSVGVVGGYALACVNTSEDFVNTSGSLEVIDIATRTIVRSIPLGGQPDAIAVGPNGLYAAVAIENERDEDLGDGEPPQLPAGFLVIVDLFGGVQDWTTRTVDLVGVADLFPEDPEPEYVDINELGIAVVTLQENNHIVLVFLPTGTVIGDFPAGTVDLQQVDVLENDLIEQVAGLDDVPREPDAVAWTGPFTFATADEGDLFGGGRGFTTWSIGGETLYEPGNALERRVARLGHYPEGRSENKGCEPEAVEYGEYADGRFLFVGSERSSVIFVYELQGLFGVATPRLRQVLPTGVAPEGVIAIPERDLLVVACEEDERDDKIRSTIMIYELAGDGESTYPTIASESRPGTVVPIPWGALSGLVAAPGADETLYTIHDSFYVKSRIYTVDLERRPAVITDELPLVDANDVLADALADLKAELPGTDDFDPAVLVNDDGTVNLDLEGISVDADGDFWLASEGRGNLVDAVSDPDDRPFESPNLLVRVSPAGTIEEVVFPPLELTRNQLRFGFEGVASVGDELFVAFQREWSAAGDPDGLVRIGRYDRTAGTWAFAYYPIETPISPNGGWVGLSELTYVGDGVFAAVERDNQGGPDAAIKLVTSFSIDGVAFAAEGGALPTLAKTVEVDLLAADVYGPTGGLVPEKQEGLAVLSDGTALIVNDNDGVDDNSGETQLLSLGDLFD